jgi:nucleoside-diphosphate-sugar epimerase
MACHISRADAVKSTMANTRRLGVKIFLVGGTGVLGRRVVPLLVEAGHDVTALARTPEAEQRLGQVGARPAKADLFDAQSLRVAVAGHAVVVNLATRIPSGMVAALPRSWAENTRIRTEGARNLVDAALHAGAGRYVQESIVFTYDDGGSAWLDESAPLKPATVTRAALAAEAHAQRLTDEGGVGVALRFATLHAHDAAHTVDAVKFLHRRISATPGAADAYLSSVMADDAATAVLAALRAPAGIYNVGDDEPLTRAEYAQASADAFGCPVPRLQPRAFGNLPMLQVLARSRRITSQRFKQATGWTPVHPSMREGWAEIARRMRAAA